MCQADRTEGNVVNVVSCNVGRASFENAADIIDDLLAVQQGLHCLQEVASWPESFELECNHKGWVALQADTPSAILVPLDWRGHIRWTESLCRHTAIVYRQ